MIEKICSVANCKNVPICRSFCNKHYQRLRTHGDPNKVIKKVRGICKLEDCEKPHASKGYCYTHYAKLHRTGTLEIIVGTDQWRRNLSKAMSSELTRLDPTRDPKNRGYLAVNVVNDIKYKARQRNKKWALDPIAVYKMITSECHYCGHKADWPKNRIGIDRKNNKLGYTPSNCVPCCFTCNSAKIDKSYDQFLSWIKNLRERTTSTQHITPKCNHPDITEFGVEVWCNLCRAKAFS